jgi:hypothetical protein
MTTACRPARRPRGFTYLELEVSFLLFAVALSGLAPLVVMHSRQVRSTETRLDADDTHYFRPSSNPWARKLGAAASLSVDPPSPTTEPVLLIDNGDPGYTEGSSGSDDWYTWSPPLTYGGNVRLNSGFDLGDQAHWEFTNLRPGPYEVLVTYYPLGSATNKAHYRVYESATPVLDVEINQRTNPPGPVHAGVPWESLGTITITHPDVLVKLDDDDRGYIVVDAARLVWRGHQVRLDSLQKSTDTESVSAVVTVTAPAP